MKTNADESKSLTDGILLAPDRQKLYFDVFVNFNYLIYLIFVLIIVRPVNIAKMLAIYVVCSVRRLVLAIRCF